jgi:two-component system, NarL family, nitrate/nitrite response regulator NarL
MEGTIKVAIIHRRRLFRECLALVLSQQQNVTVAGSVAEASELLGEMTRLCPDVIITDLAVLGQKGLEEARQLRKIFSEVKILVMGLAEQESDILACIEAGAAGYLLQEASLEELLNNIRAVAAGEALCAPKIVGSLFAKIAEDARERQRLQALGMTYLTCREHEILTLVEEGLSNKEIAVRLQIELQTVKNHVHNILEKFQLDNRREAVWHARKQGLLKARPNPDIHVTTRRVAPSLRG